MTEQTAEQIVQQSVDNIGKLRAGGEVETAAPVEEELHEIELEVEGDAELPEGDGDADEGEADKGGESDDVQAALTHGYKPYNEYIDEGGDPDMYRGPKAFVQFKEMKEKLRGEVKTGQTEAEKLRSDMDELLDMFNKTQKANTAAEKTRLEAALAEAMDEVDPKAAAEIATKLANIDGEPEAKPKEEPVVSVVSEAQQAPLVNLINSNPILDKTSDDYDFDAANSLSGRLSRRFEGQDPSQLTPERLQSVIDQEWGKVQEKFGMIKKRTTKRSPATPNGAAIEKRTAKKSVKLTSAERNLYEKMKATKPAAAKQYLETIAERPE